jgi:hypothetical protein
MADARTEDGEATAEVLAAGTVPEGAAGGGGGVCSVTPLFLPKSGPAGRLRLFQKLLTLHRRRSPTLGTVHRMNRSTKFPRGNRFLRGRISREAQGMTTTREELEAALAAEPENVALHSAYAVLPIDNLAWETNGD